jgi:hypothetical protein
MVKHLAVKSLVQHFIISGLQSHTVYITHAQPHSAVQGSDEV